MEKKSFSKRYLISILALFFAGVAISFITLYALSSRASNVDLNIAQMLLISLGCACLPPGSFAGFVFFGMRLKEKDSLSKGIIISVCIFFPITLALLTVFGIIMIIPSIIKSIHILISEGRAPSD